MAENETPRYLHDCTRCVFLGQWQEYDLYYADHGGLPDTVIARYGDDGPEYTSGLSLVPLVPALAEAKRRAMEKGLLKEMTP